MGKIDRRKYPRIQIYDPISYLCLDCHGTIENQDMGVARDVSQKGVRIETTHEIKSEYVLLMFVDLNNQLSEIEGRVVYCRKNHYGKFDTGIELMGSPQEQIAFVKKLVKSYHYRKEENRLVISEPFRN